MPAAAKKTSQIRQAASPRESRAKPSAAARALGALPEWNLADLYPAIDAPELKRDLERADAECVAFEEAYKGKLAALAAGADAGAKLAEAVRRYEALDDLLGRLISYRGPGLCRQHHRSGAREILWRHAGADHGGLAASPVLHARTQPLDDAALEHAMARSRARPLPAVDRGRAQGEALPARGPRRAAVPREVGDRRGRLEPAVRRDDGALRFKVDGKALAIEPTLNADAGREREEAPRGVRGARQDLQGEPARLHADHQHARQGQGNFRPLARLQGHRRRAASLQPRRAGSGRCAGRRGARRLSAAVASLLRAEGQVVRQEAPAALGPQRAAAQGRAAHDSVGRGAGHGAHRLRRVLAAHGGHRRALLRAQLDRCAGAAGQAARRLRASDGAVGAPLCAAQLSGQAARRDDARA